VNTPRWEFWPSLSGRWLLFGRRARGGSRRKVILFDLETGARRVLAATRSRSAFLGPGQVNGGWVVWTKCTRATACNVWRYNIAGRHRHKVPNPGRFQRAPSVTAEGTVYFVRSGGKCGSSVRLMRYFPGRRAKALVKLPEGKNIADTYAFGGRRGTKLLYDRTSCRSPVGSDIFSLAEPRFWPYSASREGAGGGTLTSRPSGIDCGIDCKHSFRAGSSIVLTATPDARSNFTGWGGACSGSAATCTLTASGARRVLAFFDPASAFSLSVTKRGSGRGRVTSSPAGIDCGTDCSETYKAGTQVTLTARPRTGSKFVGWEGACSGTGRCKVTMDRVRAVTAVFSSTTQTTFVVLPSYLESRGGAPEG
jgi:Divergent InlB B-repeat domain